MITKNDCFLLLTQLKDKGIEVDGLMKKLVSSPFIPPEVIRVINDNRQLDVSNFYENIRKNYNNKKSKLYINIVKEISGTEEVLTTLSALLTQILLYSKKADNEHMFLQNVRANEIASVLCSYFQDYDLTYCIKLLRLIKSDIKALEYSTRNQE